MRLDEIVENRWKWMKQGGRGLKYLTWMKMGKNGGKWIRWKNMDKKG